MVFNAYNQ